MENHLRIKPALDKSGDGMFSKTGRITTEQHTIFNRKNNILDNKLKYLKVSNFPAFERDLEQMNLMNIASAKGFDEDEFFDEIASKHKHLGIGSHNKNKLEEEDIFYSQKEEIGNFIQLKL